MLTLIKDLGTLKRGKTTYRWGLYLCGCGVVTMKIAKTIQTTEAAELEVPIARLRSRLHRGWTDFNTLSMGNLAAKGIL